MRTLCNYATIKPFIAHYFGSLHQSCRYAHIVAEQVETNSLNNLRNVNRLTIKQNFEWLEILTGFETNNRYEVMNPEGRLLLVALEDTGTWLRVRYGRKRPYCIRIWDMDNIQPMVLRSKVEVTGKTVSIEIPEGNLIAKIVEEKKLVKPAFHVYNSDNQVLYKITSPFAASTGSLKNVNFHIYSHDDEKTVIGDITKKWGGMLREYYTDADIFNLTFPIDMDVQWKAVMIAATLIVDMEFYESRTRGLFTRIFFFL